MTSRSRVKQLPYVHARDVVVVAANSDVTHRVELMENAVWEEFYWDVEEYLDVAIRAEFLGRRMQL